MKWNVKYFVRVNPQACRLAICYSIQKAQVLNSYFNNNQMLNQNTGI